METERSGARAPTGRLRVATWNIRHGEGRDGVIDLARTAAAIRRTGAQVVALQELDRFRQRSGGVDQPAVVAELTGLVVRFFPTFVRPEIPGEYGIALAATSPFEASFEPLPQFRDEEPRGAILARWNGIGIVSTHISYEKNARPIQTARLAELAGDLTAPVLVMGDLNQERCTLRPLRRAGFRPGPHFGTLAPCRRWGRQLDHILAGPGLVVVRAWVERSGVSDHCPLVSEAEFLPPAREVQ